MSLPIVAIVGRPNVGKSSLLNRLVGRRIAIVDRTPGVTRDRISAPLPIGEPQRDGAAGRYVELVDTGGMGIEDSKDLTGQVEDQIDYAIASAALILFVVDAREGLTGLDRHVAERLRRQDKPVILLANKVDSDDQMSEIHELHALGFGEPMAISATHARGTAELFDLICERLAGAADIRAEPVMKLAVVGKRNAGKSTFINALAGEQRVIVAEAPGTTRDSVDVTIELDGRTLMVIDTAGIRKRRRIASDVEFYGYHRAMRSIRRADVVAMMIDAAVPVSQVDKRLAGQIAEQFKPVALVVNKWDLARGAAGGEDYAEYLGKTFPELSFAPISLTVATEGTNVNETVRLAEQLFKQANTRVGTAELNATIKEIQALRGPSHKAGTRPPKILYASQVATAPPMIVCFVNDVRSFDAGYQRFLLNRLRERLPFAEVPIRLLLRQRRSKK
ncbi:MAG: ribosome biogenesis GTPase Der [Planctomycetota bacterium]|jgi:GTP-binding protein